MIINYIIFIMLSVFLFTGCCCEQKPLTKEEQIEKDKQEAEDKAEKAKIDARIARCGDNYSDVETTCESLISSKLLRPDTAKFPLLFGKHHDVNEDCSERYMSSVEAKNAFGQKINYSFTCIYNPKTKSVSIISFYIQ